MPGLASVERVDDLAGDVGGLEVEVGVTAVPVTGSSVIGQISNLNYVFLLFLPYCGFGDNAYRARSSI